MTKRKSMISRQDLLAELEIDASTLHRWQRSGLFPPPTYEKNEGVGGRLAVWPASVLELAQDLKSRGRSVRSLRTDLPGVDDEEMRAILTDEFTGRVGPHEKIELAQLRRGTFDDEQRVARARTCFLRGLVAELRRVVDLPGPVGSAALTAKRQDAFFSAVEIVSGGGRPLIIAKGAELTVRSDMAFGRWLQDRHGGWIVVDGTGVLERAAEQAQLTLARLVELVVPRIEDGARSDGKA